MGVIKNASKERVEADSMECTELISDCESEEYTECTSEYDFEVDFSASSNSGGEERCDEETSESEPTGVRGGISDSEFDLTIIDFRLGNIGLMGSTLDFSVVKLRSNFLIGLALSKK